MHEQMICCVMVVSGGYQRVQVDHLDNCVTRQQVIFHYNNYYFLPFLSIAQSTCNFFPSFSYLSSFPPPTPIQASVLFIDTGLSQMVSCSGLYSLPPAISLLNVPPLAMPCRLSGVQSTFAGGQWYFLDNQQLWKHLMKKKVCPSLRRCTVMGLNFYISRLIAIT